MDEDTRRELDFLRAKVRSIETGMVVQKNQILVTTNTHVAGTLTAENIVGVVAPGLVDHGGTTGLSDDDHVQYLNATRHATQSLHSIGTVVPHDALASLTERLHSSLTGVSADQHHAQVHALISTNHTITGAAMAVVGLTAADTLGLLTPSAAPGVASALLKTDATGLLTLQILSVTGNITVGGLVDGVDIAALKTAYDVHDAATATAAHGSVGAHNHTTDATGGVLPHSGLSGVTADQHHAQVHGITSSNHTGTGSTFGLVGFTATDTLGVLNPSSTPGAAAKILMTDAAGLLTLVSLSVSGNIVVSGTVDGVDVSAHAAATAVAGHANVGAHNHLTTAAGGQLDHGAALTGLSDDDHSQYVHNTVARTITAQHTFSPATALPPFILSANAQGQTVTGLRADQLNKSVTAGVGLTGGGALTASVTLTLGTPSTLTVSTTNSVTGTTHTHAVTASAAPGAAASLLKTDAAGALTLQTLSVIGNLTVTSDILPSLPDDSNIGSSTYPFLSAHISEMYGQRFVEETIQVAGGYWIIPKSSATLAAALDASGTTVTVGASQTWSVGDVLILRDVGKVEYMQITGGSGTAWTVTRNFDGGGANTWVAGQIVVNLGKTGDGWLVAQGGANASWSVWERTGSAYANTVETVRLGNLNGRPGYSTNVYGIHIGDASSYLKYDRSGGLVIAGNGAGLTSINGGNIQTGTITATQLAANSVTADEIAAGAVTAVKIASHVITADHIAAGTITATEIASRTITADRIAAGVITANEIAATTITAAKIAAGTITATQIASRTITADRIVAGAITANEIAATTITAAKIVSGTITATQIASRTITADRIVAAAITANEIAAGTITATQIASRTITADRIVAGAITANEIAATTITAAKIASGTITATQIAANSITVDRLATGVLGVSKTLTIGSATGARLELATDASNLATLKGINAAGTVEAYFGSDGKLYGGGGKAIIDAAGIRTVIGEEYTNEGSYRFVNNSGVEIGGVYSRNGRDNALLPYVNRVILKSINDQASSLSEANVYAYHSSGAATASLTAYGNGISSSISVTASASDTEVGLSNIGCTYGAWKVSGHHNNWYGLEFVTAAGNVSLMMSNTGQTAWTGQQIGIHRNWQGWGPHVTGNHLWLGPESNGNPTYWGHILGSHAVYSRVIKTDQYTLPNNTDYVVPWTTRTNLYNHSTAIDEPSSQLHGRTAMWDGATAIYCREEGVYEADAGIIFGNNGNAGRDWVRIVMNGSVKLGQNDGGHVAGQNCCVEAHAGKFYMHAGDYVQLIVGQISGGTRVIGGATQDEQRYAFFSLTRVA